MFHFKRKENNDCKSKRVSGNNVTQGETEQLGLQPEITKRQLKFVSNNGGAMFYNSRVDE